MPNPNLNLNLNSNDVTSLDPNTYAPPLPDHKGSFKALDGTNLEYRCWLSPAACKGTLLIVHGIGEHGLCYGFLVRGLLLAGYHVYSYDHRGHGLSDGQRGHINSWADYRNDLKTMVNLVQQAQAKPIFMYAHSMGAIVALDFLTHYPTEVQGSIINGAPFKPQQSVSPLLVHAAKLLSGIAPKVSLPLKLEVSSISRHPDALADFNSDPFRHKMASARWGVQMLNTIDWVNSNAKQIYVPVFLMHGQNDQIALAIGTRTFFTQISSLDKTIKIYADGVHQSHNDLHYSEVVADIVSWLGTHNGEVNA